MLACRSLSRRRAAQWTGSAARPPAAVRGPPSTGSSWLGSAQDPLAFPEYWAELIAAGMLILAGGGRGLPLDYDDSSGRTRIGYEWGTRSRKGER